MIPYTPAEQRVLRRTWNRIIRHLEKHGATDGLCELIAELAPSHTYAEAERDRLEWMMGQPWYAGYFWPLWPGLNGRAREEDTTPRILAAMWMRETLADPWGDDA